jgi:hypothetical protein
MFHLTRQPSKGKRPHLKDMSLPDPVSCSIALCRCEIAAKKKRFLTFGTTALSRDAFHWVHKDSRNSGTSQKGEKPYGRLLHFT